MMMMIKLTPQVVNNKSIEVYYQDEIIKINRYNLDILDSVINEEGQETEGEVRKSLSDTIYIDLFDIEYSKVYYIPEWLQSVRRDEDGILNVEIMNPINEQAPGSDKFPEWFESENSDFVIPDDAEIVRLEEMILDGPRLDPVEQLNATNKALEVKIDALNKRMTADRKASEALTLELLGLMSGIL